MAGSYFPESFMGRRDLFALFYRRKWVLFLAFGITVGVHLTVVHLRPPLFVVNSLAEIRSPDPMKYGLGDLAGIGAVQSARESLIFDLVQSVGFEAIVAKDLDERFVHLGNDWNLENFSIVPDPSGQQLRLSYESPAESTQPILAAARAAINTLLLRAFSESVSLVRANLEARITAQRLDLSEREETLTEALLVAELSSSLDSENARSELLSTIAILEVERSANDEVLQLARERIASATGNTGEQIGLADLEGFAVHDSIRALAKSLVDTEIAVLRMGSTMTATHPDMRSATLQLEEQRRVYRSVFDADSPFHSDIRAAIAKRDKQLEAKHVALAEEAASLEGKSAEYQRLIDEHRGVIDRIDAHRTSLRSLTAQRNASLLSLTELEDSARRLNIFESLDAPDIRQLRAPGPAIRTTANAGELLGVVVLLALIFSVGAGYVMESVDQRIHDVHVLRRLTDLPILGSLPVADSSSSKIPAPGEPPVDPENFNTIIKKLLTHLKDDHRVVAITGPDENAGKSYVSSNLAIAAGRLGLKTLLVDADFRRPSLYSNFGVSRFPGLSGWLDGTERGHRETLYKTIELAADGRTALRVRPQNVPRIGPAGVGVLVSASDDATCVTQHSGHTCLSLITSGRRVENSGILLQSGRMDEFMEWARESFDLCLIDSPPLRQVADTLLVAGRADGSLLVAGAGHTSSQDLQWACDALAEVGSTLVGTILNGVPFGNRRY